MPPLLGLVLARRDVASEQEAQEFIHPDYDRDIHDPFEFREMKKAVDAISEAISTQASIMIHGDYDADGISASSLLYVTLKKLGARVDVFLPDREKDGYGLREKTVEQFADQGVNLVITCDCGISDGPAIEIAHNAGVAVIVTDHHTIPEQPPQHAIAIIHPLMEEETYPCKTLSGGGVAFKLAQALIRTHDDQFASAEAFEKWLVDYVAISSVADMVPLQGETRSLTHFGLKVLPRSQRPGLRLLVQSSGRDVNERSIGFYIAPRINAAGRMDHPKIAFHALVETDPVKAYGYVQELQALNEARYKAVDVMMKEIDQELQDSSAKDGSIILVQGEWMPSLAGLAASRVANRYHKPVLVVAKGEQGLVGSGRSVEGVDLIAILREHEQFFERLGGHPQACGFTLKEGVFEELAVTLQRAEIEPQKRTLKIDAHVPLELASLETVDEVKKLGPFGQGNPAPIFVSRVVPVAADRIGANQKHLRMTVRAGNTRYKVIGFGAGELHDQIELQKPAELAYNLDINEWQGRKEVQVELLDIRQ